MVLKQKKYNEHEVLGYPIFCDQLNNIGVNDKLLINTINQYSFCLAEKDKSFQEALKKSDILLPDGVGITLAAKFLKGVSISKIAGADIHSHLLEKLNADGGSCFYMGSSSATLSKIEQKMLKDYPNIRTGFYSPPFKKEFDNEDNKKIVDAVNIFKPDVLFVGMTAPKQEKWSYKLKDELNVSIICSIGAVFDFFAGTIERPGKVWQNLGLEWLGRLLKEPKRMFKRYIYYGLVYSGYLLKQKLKT